MEKKKLIFCHCGGGTEFVFVFYYRAKNILWACFIMIPRIFWEVLAEVSLAEVVELLQLVL